MRTRLLPVFTGILLATACVFAQSKPTIKPHNYARWEKEMARLAREDAANPPPKGALLFTGASSIVKWKSLPQDYPSAKTINHGFGGCQICDVTYFADRIIFPFEPKMIFLRAGGNDMHAGKTPREVLQDYKDFVAKIRTKLPNVPIVFISQCPAPKWWNERDKAKQLDDLVKAYTKQTPGLECCETYDLSIDPSGNPRRDLYVSDGLHFNDAGYKLLADRVRPFIPNE